MRHFHYTRNMHHNPTINVDKLWTLVPEEHKKELTADSEVVPVLDLVRLGYSKVLGNGQCVSLFCFAPTEPTFCSDAITMNLLTLHLRLQGAPDSSDRQGTLCVCTGRVRISSPRMSFCI